MFRKVSIEEIKRIGGRLRSELRGGNLPLHRKVEVESLLYHLDVWLEWKADYDRNRLKEQLKNEK